MFNYMKANKTDIFKWIKTFGASIVVVATLYIYMYVCESFQDYLPKMQRYLPFWSIWITRWGNTWINLGLMCSRNNASSCSKTFTIFTS